MTTRCGVGVPEHPPVPLSLKRKNKFASPLPNTLHSVISFELNENDSGRGNTTFPPWGADFTASGGWSTHHSINYLGRWCGALGLCSKAHILDCSFLALP